MFKSITVTTGRGTSFRKREYTIFSLIPFGNSHTDYMAFGRIAGCSACDVLIFEINVTYPKSVDEPEIIITELGKLRAPDAIPKNKFGVGKDAPKYSITLA